MALFRVDFSGRGELAERQQKLAQMLSRLQKISEGLNQDSRFLCVNIHAINTLSFTRTVGNRSCWWLTGNSTLIIFLI